MFRSRKSSSVTKFCFCCVSSTSLYLVLYISWHEPLRHYAYCAYLLCKHYVYVLCIVPMYYVRIMPIRIYIMYHAYVSIIFLLCFMPLRPEHYATFSHFTASLRKFEAT